MVRQPLGAGKPDKQYPPLWAHLRRRLERGHWLRTSECGQGTGEWIELEGKTVGRLSSPEFVDMFWVSYRIEDASPVLLEDPDVWLNRALQYKSAAREEYAPNAIASIEVPVSSTQTRVLMRGLHLNPQGMMEKMAYHFPHLARFLLRLLPHA